MTGREYDNIPNFQNISFPLGLILKIITWPILIFSGFFLFFTIFFFQSLGLMMIYFNIGIYYRNKKKLHEYWFVNFINFGCFIQHNFYILF